MQTHELAPGSGACDLRTDGFRRRDVGGRPRGAQHYQRFVDRGESGVSWPTSAPCDGREGDCEVHLRHRPVERQALAGASPARRRGKLRSPAPAAPFRPRSFLDQERTAEVRLRPRPFKWHPLSGMLLQRRAVGSNRISPDAQSHANAPRSASTSVTRAFWLLGPRNRRALATHLLELAASVLRERLLESRRASPPAPRGAEVRCRGSPASSPTRAAPARGSAPPAPRCRRRPLPSAAPFPLPRSPRVPERIAEINLRPSPSRSGSRSRVHSASAAR